MTMKGEGEYYLKSKKGISKYLGREQDLKEYSDFQVFMLNGCSINDAFCFSLILY